MLARAWKILVCSPSTFKPNRDWVQRSEVKLKMEWSVGRVPERMSFLVTSHCWTQWTNSNSSNSSRNNNSSNYNSSNSNNTSNNSGNSNNKNNNLFGSWCKFFGRIVFFALALVRWLPPVASFELRVLSCYQECCQSRKWSRSLTGSLVKRSRNNILHWFWLEITPILVIQRQCTIKLNGFANFRHFGYF